MPNLSLLTTVTSAALMLLPARVLADGEDTERWPDTAQLLVMPFPGADGTAARATVLSSLGQTKTYHVLNTKQTDPDVRKLARGEQELTDVAEGLHATLVITGKAGKDSVLVQVLSGHSGALLAEHAFPAKAKFGASVAGMVEQVLAGKTPVVQDAPEPIVVAHATAAKTKRAHKLALAKRLRRAHTALALK
jgi:hypothetical protein